MSDSMDATLVDMGATSKPPATPDRQDTGRAFEFEGSQSPAPRRQVLPSLRTTPAGGSARNVLEALDRALPTTTPTAAGNGLFGISLATQPKYTRRTTTATSRRGGAMGDSPIDSSASSATSAVVAADRDRDIAVAARLEARQRIEERRAALQFQREQTA
eukprot:PhF_6_TR43201/c0_g1_i1/m.66185